MDPLSVAAGSASLAVLCHSVAKALYSVFSDVRNAGENFSGLYQELLGFSRVLEAIDNTWNQNPAVLAAHSDSNLTLWASVKENLDSSSATMQKLETMLQDVEKGSLLGRGLFRKPAKAFKLNLYMSEIASYRQRINSHHIAMQGGLQMISLCLHLQGNSSQERLGYSLAKLGDQIRLIEQRIEISVRSAQSPDSISSQERTEKQQIVRSLERLAREAKSFHSSARSEVESRGSTIYQGTVVGASVMGDPLTEEQYDKIKNWIPPPRINEKDYTNTTSIQPTSGSSWRTTSGGFGSSNTNVNSSDDIDSGSDIDRELTRKMAELVMENMASGNYPKAEVFLRQAIDQMSNEGGVVAEMNLMKVQLAFVLVIQEKWNEAEDTIITFASDKSLYPLGAYHILHAFAIRCFFQGDQTQAIRYSKKALWGKKRHIGQTHPSYQESLRLLSDLYQNSGQITKAEACRALIAPNAFNKAAVFDANLAQVYISQNISEVLDCSLMSLRPADSNNMTHSQSTQSLSAIESSAHLPPLQETRVKDSHLPTPSGQPRRALSVEGATADRPQLSIGHFVQSQGSQKSPSHNQARPRVATISSQLASKDLAHISMQPAQNSVMTGSVETEKPSPSKGVDPVTTKWEWTPLLSAAHNGHAEVVKLLLDQGADFQAANTTGATPLFMAANAGHIDVVKLLLDSGADVTVAGPDGYTLLNAAAYNGHLEVVKLLLDFEADISIAGNNGFTPLNSAAHNGHFEVVKLLLDSEADISIVANNGFAPLHSAAYNGHLEVVKLLLEKGADAKAANITGATPLFLATNAGHIDVVKLLLDSEADVTVAGADGYTPLNEAAYRGHLEVVKLLLEKGASFEVANNNGFTPLNTAAHYGHLEIVKLLLDSGADVTITGNDGFTPLNSAAYSGHLEVVKLLLDFKADVSVIGNNGVTPLNSAAHNGHLEVVKLLLEKGADAKVRRGSGM